MSDEKDIILHLFERIHTYTHSLGNCSVADENIRSIYMVRFLDFTVVVDIISIPLLPLEDPLNQIDPKTILLIMFS